MRQIEPIQNTTDGNLATQLLVTIVTDDLLSFCSFDWKLFDDNGTLVNNGLLSCFGEDYSNWNGNNDYPYSFVATAKNLTLL